MKLSRAKSILVCILLLISVMPKETHAFKKKIGAYLVGGYLLHKWAKSVHHHLNADTGSHYPREKVITIYRTPSAYPSFPPGYGAAYGGSYSNYGPNSLSWFAPQGWDESLLGL